MIRTDVLRANYGSTPWQEKNQVITSVSWVSRIADARDSLMRSHGDLMILFAARRGDALTRFLVEDGGGREPRFWPLAQALSALYPSHTEEKRWVDGVLAKKRGLGF